MDITPDLLLRLNNTFKGICSRCSDPRNRHYGARGISVDKRWEKNPLVFIVFCLKNGWKPGLEVDRIDNDKDYTPKNVQFVSHCINLANRGHGNLKTGFGGRTYKLPLNISFAKSRKYRQKPYCVVVKREGRTFNVGSFKTLPEAVRARDEALRRIDDKQ